MKSQLQATCTMEREALARRLARLHLPERTRSLLAQELPGYSASDRASAQAAATLQRLVALLAGGEVDAASCRALVESLVGLGPGLTPTGDDFLIALLGTGRELARIGLLSSHALDTLEAAVRAVPPGRTTPRAEELLCAAVAGDPPAPLAAGLAALLDASADDERLAARIATLAATGAHSGCDWLAAIVALDRACLSRVGGGRTTNHEQRISASREGGSARGPWPTNHGLQGVTT